MPDDAELGDCFVKLVLSALEDLLLGHLGRVIFLNSLINGLINCQDALVEAAARREH